MYDGVGVLVGDVGVTEWVSVSDEVSVKVMVEVGGIPVTEKLVPIL